jgi:hypothetical protein
MWLVFYAGFFTFALACIALMRRAGTGLGGAFVYGFIGIFALYLAGHSLLAFITAR